MEPRAVAAYSPVTATRASGTGCGRANGCRRLTSVSADTKSRRPASGTSRAASAAAHPESRSTMAATWRVADSPVASVSWRSAPSPPQPTTTLSPTSSPPSPWLSTAAPGGYTRSHGASLLVHSRTFVGRSPSLVSTSGSTADGDANATAPRSRFDGSARTRGASSASRATSPRFTARRTSERLIRLTRSKPTPNVADTGRWSDASTSWRQYDWRTTASGASDTRFRHSTRSHHDGVRLTTSAPVSSGERP